MSEIDLTSLSIENLSQLLRSRQVSPVELTDAVLARIERVEPTLNAYITVLAQSASADARRAEDEIGSGHYRGPLHGIPVGLKDIFQTKGVLTTAGSRVLEDHVPSEDATVVARLRSAGAIVIGKHNLDEFARGVTTSNPVYGSTRNPWNVNHIPGGSSGGSAAAVAAGECTFALGTDTGGSTRIPAACCGVIGVVPTYGRVSRHGILPLAWSLDRVGILTNTVGDAAFVLNVIAGSDARDPTTSDVPVPDYLTEIDDGIKGLRIGVPQDYFFDRIDGEVSRTIERAIHTLEDQGAVATNVRLPHVELSLVTEYVIASVEATSFHETWLRERAEKYSASLLAKLEAGHCISAPAYLKAQRLRSLIKDGFDAALANSDVIITPTVPVPAVPHGTQSVTIGESVDALSDCMLRLTCPANLSGHPVAAIPCGLSQSGLPLSLQIIGRRYDERLLLCVARACEVSAGRSDKADR